jgi:hypothetical protein
MVLSGHFYTDIYSKKIKRNLLKIKKNLIGEWILDKINISLIFYDNNVKVLIHNDYGDIIEEYIETYKLEEYYLQINNIESIVKGIYAYNNTFLYNINDDILCLLEAGGGELIPQQFILYKSVSTSHNETVEKAKNDT